MSSFMTDVHGLLISHNVGVEKSVAVYVYVYIYMHTYMYMYMCNIDDAMRRGHRPHLNNLQMLRGIFACLFAVTPLLSLKCKQVW